MSRVLIIEDEPTLRTSMARGLARLPGVEIAEAGTMAEAVAALDASSPQLVLSDIDLPDRSGVEILAEISRRERRIPVVFISAYLKAYGSQIPRHADIETYEKPISLEDLRAIVTARLGAEPGDAPPPFAARDYLQLACFGRHSVLIQVPQAGAEPGQIVVSRGDVWSACDAYGTGEAALRRLLRVTRAWAGCRTLSADPGARNVHRGWQAILLDSAADNETGADSATDGGACDGYVLLVEPDDGLREQLAGALRQSGIDVRACADAATALERIAALRPALLFSRARSESADAAVLLDALSRSPELATMPRVALSVSGAPADLLDGLERGADDIVTLSMGAPAIVSKLRTVLRLVKRVTASQPAGRAVSGALGAGGALALVKLCETRRLNARLTVEGQGVTRWIDFAGGEMAGAGAEPETPGEDALDALLAAVEGTYRIELRDPALDDIEGAAAPAGGRDARVPADASDDPAGIQIPTGRLSAVDVEGAPYQVQTEGTNRGVFTITTIIARDGQVVRKLESAWERPLTTHDDARAARADIDRQHESALAETRAAAPRPLSAPAAPQPAAQAGPRSADDAQAFEAACERALSALLGKDHAGAALAFVEAARLRPDDARVRANLERLRQMGHTVGDDRDGMGG